MKFQLNCSLFVLLFCASICTSFNQQCDPTTTQCYENVNVSQLKTSIERRHFVVHIMREAWNAYVKHAWGQSGLRTGAQEDYANALNTFDHTGTTIVGSMSTLWLMGLMDEFEKGRDWIETRLAFGDNPTFGKMKRTEIVNQFLGSMLSCYALTGDVFFLKSARAIGDGLRYYVQQSAPEIMEQILEFQYLINTNWYPAGFDGGFETEVKSAQDNTANDTAPSYYLSKAKNYVKFFQLLNRQKQDIQAHYLDAIKQMETSKPIDYLDTFNWTTVKRDGTNNLSYKDCQLGATFALAANQLLNKNYSNVERFLKIAHGIAEFCHLDATNTGSGLPVASFKVVSLFETNKPESNLSTYGLEPELFETYFVLYRLTGERKYREYAWQLLESIYKHARTSRGYSTLAKVTRKVPVQEGFQPAIFLSATLKYLYLINIDRSDVLSLDEWVFNAAGQPLPVCGVNLAQPKCPIFHEREFFKNRFYGLPI